MRTMHYRVLALSVWLLFFYNVERVRWFIGAGRIQFVTRYAYVFVALTALIALAFPVLQRLPLSLLASGGVVGFLVFKAWFGYPLWGEALPVTVTEICAFLVTGMLTRQVIWAIQEFETSIVNFTIRHIGRPTKAFAVEQGEMYHEVRRARAFNRPLALMAIELGADSFRVATEKMVEEVQQAAMKQYVLAALAKKLEDQLGPYGIIAQDGDKFLVLLPEVAKEDIPRLTARLRGEVQESIGLELRIGAATLPEVETFDELVEAAYAETKSKVLNRSGEAVVPKATSVHGQLASR